MSTELRDGRALLEKRYGGLSIERWRAPLSAEQITEHALRRRRPVILQGLIDHWPARSTWSLDHFGQRFGRLFTNAFATGDEAEAKMMRFGPLVERMRAGEVLYSSFYARDALGVLRPDYPLDDIVLGDPAFNWLLELPRSVQGEINVFFVGNRGTGIANHMDSLGTHLWSAQITGRKRWWVSPTEMGALTANGAANWRTRERDIERFPEFERAACLDFVLEPGEVLILPVGWWHETEILEDSISITHDIVNDTNFRGYDHELDASRAIDPKGARIYDESADHHARWRQRLKPRATTPVPEVEPTVGFDALFDRFMTPGEPVVIKGLVSDWPAVGKWDIAYFREHFGRFFVQAFERYDDQNKRVRLARFLSEERDRPRYAMWCLDDCIEVMKADFGAFPFLDDDARDWTRELPREEQRALTWVFLGLAGSGIGCHADRLGQHVASGQLLGRKAWWLHPPSDGRWLYDGEVDLSDPDLRAHPLYENASPARVCVLEPGDVLLLPNGWWHQTRALTDSISLSHDFCNLSNADSFLERLAHRRGADYLETDGMRPIVGRWRARLAEHGR